MMTPPVTAVPYFDEAAPSTTSGATTVLMLHGIGGGRQAFARQMRPLADAGFHAVAWDMPGYGHSALVEPYSFEALADECIELIDVLMPERLVLLGHSMGGMVAQEVAARAPERIAALVLAGTTAAFGKADGAWQRGFVEQRTAPLAAGLSMRELSTQLVNGMVAPGASEAARSEAIEVMSHVPPPTYRLALQALVGFDRRAQLAGLAMPTLLIAGSDDPNAPPQIMRRMAERMHNARVVELERCGHLMNFEHPDAFNAALLGFLHEIRLSGT
jgi:3-oxoadipate enol-lactonase